MRLWTLHPKYLDSKGLVAAWRETLLAQKVLQGLTKGYTKHPQLIRFRSCEDPLSAISAYLTVMWEEAKDRGFKFDKEKIIVQDAELTKISVTKGQLVYEMKHLLTKLKVRDLKRFNTYVHNDKDYEEECECEAERVEEFLATEISTHPLFEIVEGDVESWEKVTAPPATKKRRRKRKVEIESDDDSTIEEEEIIEKPKKRLRRK